TSSHRTSSSAPRLQRDRQLLGRQGKRERRLPLPVPGPSHSFCCGGPAGPCQLPPFPGYLMVRALGSLDVYLCIIHERGIWYCEASVRASVVRLPEVNHDPCSHPLSSVRFPTSLRFAWIAALLGVHHCNASTSHLSPTPPSSRTNT